MTLTSPQLLQIVSAAFVMGCLYYLRQQAPPASAEPSLLRGGAPSAPLSGLYVSAPAKGAAGGAPRVPLPLFPTSYSCTAEEVALQVGRLVPFESACPGSEWWPRLLAAGMSCRDLVMVDIGANKGYKLATWAGVFRPQMGLFPDTLLQRFSEVYREFEDMWGTCQDSADPRLPLIAGRDCDAGAPVAGGGAAAGPPRAADSYKLEVHAFEPLPGNAGILHKVLEPWFVEKGGGTASLTVHQLAMVGDKSISQVEFGACLAGNERCGVKTDGYDGGEVYSKGNVVSAITVDAWFAENGIQRVDVLAIDAEGHDPEVLKGADDVLRRQGARIVEFECVEERPAAAPSRLFQRPAPHPHPYFPHPGTTCCASGEKPA